MVCLVHMATERSFDSEVFFAALADRTRLRLLNLMRNGEVCVCFFAETLDTNNPKISRHLAYLRRASLVTGRRDGKWIHYRISPPTNEKAAEVFGAVMEMLKDDQEMRLDSQRLVNVCCSPRTLVSIQRDLRRQTTPL